MYTRWRTEHQLLALAVVVRDELRKTSERARRLDDAEFFTTRVHEALRIHTTLTIIVHPFPSKSTDYRFSATDLTSIVTMPYYCVRTRSNLLADALE